MSNQADTTHRNRVATPRSKGAVSGFLLVALGAWGALIPFVGTYFHYDYTPTSHWTMTSARFFLEVAPGIVAIAGGLLLLVSRNRFTASAGGYAALAAGAWFIVGPILAPLFRTGYLGDPTGGKTHVALEHLGFFYGLGGMIVLLSAFALGRFSVVGVRDIAAGRARAARKIQDDPPRSPRVSHEEGTTPYVDDTDRSVSDRAVTDRSATESAVTDRGVTNHPDLAATRGRGLFRFSRGARRD